MAAADWPCNPERSGRESYRAPAALAAALDAVYLVHRGKQMIHLIGRQSLMNYRVRLNRLSESVH